MNHDAHSLPPEVPAELVAEKRAGWMWFTHFTVANCVAVAAILVLMLIFLRIL